MEITLFFKGLAIGVCIAAPVGPIGILCIQRTLAEGSTIGFLSGIGAATADAIYGFIAAFGLTCVSKILIEQQFWLGLIGGAFLCYLGITALISKPQKHTVSEKNLGHIEAYGTTFFLTLMNPMTILSFAFIFAGLGIVNPSLHYVSASLLVIGVFLGSGLWWFILTGISGLFRRKVTRHTLAWINKISGTLITTFGLVILISLIV